MGMIHDEHHRTSAYVATSSGCTMLGTFQGHPRKFSTWAYTPAAARAIAAALIESADYLDAKAAEDEAEAAS